MLYPNHDPLPTSLAEHCSKWRKVPTKKILKGLPDSWFCDMNTWDPSLASCEADTESGADDSA